MTTLTNTGGKKLGVEMGREEPLRLPWGCVCGRCKSTYTVKEVYASKTEPEYWCRYCGTELKSDGSVLFPRGEVTI